MAIISLNRTISTREENVYATVTQQLNLVDERQHCDCASAASPNPNTEGDLSKCIRMIHHVASVLFVVALYSKAQTSIEFKILKIQHAAYRHFVK